MSPKNFTALSSESKSKEKRQGGSLLRSWTSSCGMTVIAVVGFGPSSAFGGGSLICDQLTWIGKSGNAGTVLHGTELPEELPSVNTAGIVFTPPSGEAIEFAASQGDDFAVDALTISFASSAGTFSFTNFASIKGSFQNEFGFTFNRPIPGDMSRGTWRGTIGPLRFEMSDFVPDSSESAGLNEITFVVTNLGASDVTDVVLLRSLNPSIQVNAASPVPSLAMSLGDPATALGVDPSTQYTIALAGTSKAVVSVEGTLVTDPESVLGSPRDPMGAIENTAMNIAYDIGTIQPGVTITRKMFIAVGRTPQNALERIAAVLAGGKKIPTVSDWGMVILMLSLLVLFKIKFGRRPAAKPR